MNAADSPGLSYFLQTFLYQLPSVIVLSLGLMISLVFLVRHPKPAIICGASMLLLLGTMFGVAIAQSALISSMQSRPDPEKVAGWLQVVSLVGSCIRAGGMLLLISAVFVSRGAPAVRKS